MLTVRNGFYLSPNIYFAPRRLLSTIPRGVSAELASQHREILDGLSKNLGFKTWQDWYFVEAETIKHWRSIDFIKQYYSGSFIRTLITLYPEHPWNRLSFKSSHLRLYWKDIDNQKDLLDSIAKELNITQWESWYHVRRIDIIKRGGGPVLSLYDNSVAKAVMGAYPEHPWDLMAFDCTIKRDGPFGTSTRRKDHRAFFDGLWEEFELDTFEDWYQVRVDEVTAAGGGSVLSAYNDSIIQALQGIYPEHQWRPWKFIKLPSGFFTDKDNQRSFFELSAAEFNIKHWEDWYRISRERFINAGGGSLLSLYADQPINALAAVYPQHDWKLWKSVSASRELFQNRAVHREFFDDLYDRLQLKSYKDWYKILCDDIQKHPGSFAVLDRYGGSRIKALTTLYPEHPWEILSFDRLPNSFWNSEENITMTLEWLKKKLRIEKPEDWARVTTADFTLHGCALLLVKKGGINKLITSLYPEYDKTSYKSVGKNQSLLFYWIQKLFPQNEDIHMEYIHPDFQFESSNRSMELDIFIPSLSLAFEYQGESHYKQEFNMFTGVPERKERDKMKLGVISKAGITLLQIPYWWNRSDTSLIATIRNARPDLLIAYKDADYEPIPQTKPETTKKSKRAIRMPKPKTAPSDSIVMI